MMHLRFLSAILFAVISTAAVAQTTSPNLVPLPNHWTTNGQSVVQSYAINQALALSGSDVRINGFDYGYQYNLGSSWTQCTWVNNGVCVQTQTYNPRVDVNVSIRDSANAQIYGTTHIETGVNTGNVSRHYELRFADPRDMLTLGNFNYTASTSTNATVFGMYSRAVYTIVDPCVSNPQSSPACPGYKTYYNMWDDGYAQVNLPFAFPFYGQTFTTSYMFTNGVVGFLNTNLWGYCCDGTDLNQQAVNGNTSWNFAIYALNTDLYPGQNSRFYTQQTDGGTGLKYTWENVVEIGTNYENTFSVNIKDTGYIGINYEKVNLSAWRNPLIGIAGDVSQGQYSQYYFGQASGLPNLAGTTLTYTGTETTDICAINPLYNSSCPGYQQAYFNQQCSINSLYDPSCPGYQQAYFTQQCSANQLYDVACPGYAQAYYDYQCNADPLYHTGCPGYQQAYFDQQCSADPLYNNQCSGYQQAYFDQQCALDGLYNTACPNYADAYYVQQCTISPLYDSGCTGYAEAYFSQQCGLDPLYNNQCPGYDTAFFNQQCSISALYNNQCPGYDTAFFNQQCSISALYNNQCPGYDTAFFNQQCSISALYNNQCPGYTEAYFSQQCSLDGLYDTQCPNYQQASCEYQGTGKWVSSSGVCVGLLPVAGDSQISNPIAISNPTSTTSDPVASAAPVVADPIVNQAVTSTATSASPAAATATVSLVSKPESAATTPTTIASASEEKKEEQKEETKTADSDSSSSTNTASSGTTSKDQPKTTRQALAERRLEAARAKAIEDGKQLASKMGEAASIEAQIQVQAVVVAAMSFVPGFDNYNKATLPDAVGYRPFEIYRGQQNIDNPAGRRFLTGADRLHQEMVDSQYQLTRSE
jgi:hypothetical protein